MAGTGHRDGTPGRDTGQQQMKQPQKDEVMTDEHPPHVSTAVRAAVHAARMDSGAGTALIPVLDGAALTWATVTDRRVVGWAIESPVTAHEAEVRSNGRLVVVGDKAPVSRELSENGEADGRAW